MVFKRKLSFIFHVYKYKIYGVTIVVTTLIYCLLKLSILCTNLQAWHQASKMCKEFDNNNSLGSLCEPVCHNKDIKYFICHTFGSTKEAVFSVELHNTRFVFKSVLTNLKSLHWYDNGVLKYPTEKDFLITLRAVVKKKLNINLSQGIEDRLMRLTSQEETNIARRHKEMENIWTLIQNNEFLLSAIYADTDIFPQVLGTCGSFFAVEYVEPLGDVSQSLSDTVENWSSRLRTSIQILQLLETFATNFREPLHLCDIKLEHFGFVKSTNKLKFVDLDGVFPHSIINRILNKRCKKDEDCMVYDCKSMCLEETKRCDSYLLNNNLQIVCEKIFVGWRLSNTVIVPGLLMSQHTPGELASILRQCAGLKNEEEKLRAIQEEDLQERLYNVLTEIEQSVNNKLL